MDKTRESEGGMKLFGSKEDDWKDKKIVELEREIGELVAKLQERAETKEDLARIRRDGDAIIKNMKDDCEKRVAAAQREQTEADLLYLSVKTAMEVLYGKLHEPVILKQTGDTFAAQRDSLLRQLNQIRFQGGIADGDAPPDLSVTPGMMVARIQAY